MESALKTCQLPCPRDVRNVPPGIIDIEDLLTVLAAWGNTGAFEPADVAPLREATAW